jgi:hypothetical protein
VTLTPRGGAITRQFANLAQHNQLQAAAPTKPELVDNDCSGAAGGFKTIAGFRCWRIGIGPATGVDHGVAEVGLVAGWRSRHADHLRWQPWHQWSQGCGSLRNGSRWIMSLGLSISSEINTQGSIQVQGRRASHLWLLGPPMARTGAARWAAGPTMTFFSNDGAKAFLAN